MPNPIRLGVLGFAHGHVNMYLGRWKEQPDLGVTAVAGWDHDAARAQAAATAHGVAIEPSADALLARTDIDAVIVASETAHHADLVVRAAAAGRPIILQKPLALTPDEADRMVAAVEAAGVPFTLAWQMRTDPHNLQTRALLADGRFGKVMMLRRKHCLSTHRWNNFEGMWHAKPEMAGDIFADDAAHAMDYVYWMLGLPKTAMAELGTLRNPRIKNDTAIALFRYPDGAFAEVVSSFIAPASENCAEITCERGMIVLNYGDATSTDVTWPNGAIQMKWYLEGENRWVASDLPPIRRHGERIAGLAAPLADFLHGRRPPIATVREGRDVLRMIMACYASAENGRRVDL